jgi:uncharacterized heparinase superfamily protein
LSNISNYFHTVRYLRPIQVLGRIRFKLTRFRPDERAAPAQRVASKPCVPPISPPQSMIGPDRFRFLNREGTCSEAVQWQGAAQSKLWTYNLHYFDDLNAIDASARESWHQRLLDRWIDENPPGHGIGWDPYPLSRRAVNWMKWSLGGGHLAPKARQSLAVQVRWLGKHIETHLQGNHLFANAKALVYAGLYFGDAESERWLTRGLSMVQTQIGEQVLADGGHFERSPMYHAGFLEDLLDMIGVMKAYGRSVDAFWSETASRMMAWLEAMSHPDKNIAFFNDAAFGIFPAPDQLREYAERLGVAMGPLERLAFRTLMPSGYVSADQPPFFLVCDVAPIGPDHLPAHAHADALSFEMSFNNRRVFVNSGTSEYGTSAERQRQRGTAAHNTLELDGENSSEVWAGFRVARRSRARLLRAQSTDRAVCITGQHNGYRRLPGLNVHQRSWTMSPRDLLIEDTIEGRFRSAKCYFHLHPEVRVERVASLALRLGDSRGGLLDVSFEGATGVDVVDSTWHPEFGVAIANNCIIARLNGPHLTTWIRRSAVD